MKTKVLDIFVNTSDRRLRKLKAYLKNIVYALPSRIEYNSFDSRLTKKTGIHQRHIVETEECASDLAVRAAEKLFEQGVERKTIDYLLFCTQSPDYVLPTTACILQHRLELSSQCGAIDFNLGCSGYIYGLSIAKGLIETGQAKCVLFLTAETYSKYIRVEDSVSRPLFGDGASATLIVGLSTDREGMQGFVFGTDGSGYQNLIVPAGGARYQSRRLGFLDANEHENRVLQMNGAMISQFAMDVVPDTMNSILNKCSMSKKDVDYFVFHQANKFMLDFLQAKCELLDYPYWNDVEKYGNTVSCSIPIALSDILTQKPHNILGCVMLIGFGVGLSWGGCMVNLSNCIKN